MLKIIMIIISASQALPNIVYNPCSIESLRRIEGSAIGSCAWAYKYENASLQQACQMGAQHFIGLRIPGSEKAHTPCTRETIVLAQEFQNIQCERIYSSSPKHVQACKDGVQSVMESLERRFSVL